MDDIHFEKSNLDLYTEYIRTNKIPEEIDINTPFPDIIQNVIDKIIEEYNKELSEAVATLDINNFKAVVEKWYKKGFFHDCFSLPSDEVLEITIRKMAINIKTVPEIPEEVKEEAKAWLLARGYDLKLE